MNRMLSIVLIVLMFFHSFEKISILIYYQTYQEYIAQYLCKNREQPELHCNGRCFLMNRLRTADESQSTPVVPDNQKSEFVMMEARGLSDFAAKRAAPLISTVRQLVEIEFMFNIFIPPKS